LNRERIADRLAAQRLAQFEVGDGQADVLGDRHHEAEPGVERPPVRTDFQVQYPEQLALGQQRHADAGRRPQLAGVLADQPALAVVDGVRAAAPQRPAIVDREDRRRVDGAPLRHRLDQAAARSDDADRTGFLGEQLARHRLDDAVGLVDAAAGA
jgi:hypothetical protein